MSKKRDFATLTYADAKIASDWAQKVLGIEDWQIVLRVQDIKPAWVDDGRLLGSCVTQPEYKKAELWISNAEAVRDEKPVLATLFHEILHVAAADCGVADDGTPHLEYLWNRMADIMRNAFLA